MRGASWGMLKWVYSILRGNDVTVPIALMLRSVTAPPVASNNHDRNGSEILLGNDRMTF